jgi:hypothetical protein
MTTEPLTPSPAPPPDAASAASTPQEGVYKDDDLVYVDPDAKIVVGRVEWNRNGNPKSLPWKEEKPVEGKEERKKSFRKQYPWGTYRSMKGVYKLEGKQKRTDPHKTLDDIMEKALKEAFWD